LDDNNIFGKIKSNTQTSPSNINFNSYQQNKLSHLDSDKINKHSSSFSEIQHSILSSRGVLNSSRISNRSGSNLVKNKVKLNLDPTQFNND